MKKIIAAFIMIFAFCFTVSAQEKEEVNPQILAKTELNALSKVISLDNEIQVGLYKLLVYKHETLAKATSNQEKVKMYDIMESKLNSTLTPEQMITLKNDKKLYKDLIQ